MSHADTHEPISWLRLERYHLGECEVAERQAIERHLAECDACRASLDSIGADDRPLPALPPLAAPAREAANEGAGSRLARFLRPAFAGPALAAAAAVLLAIVVWPEAPVTEHPPARILFKGGELSLSLVRERVGVTTEDPRAFAAGDRFLVRLTSALPGQTHWDVVVFQGSEVSFPHAAPQPVASGNLVPLPGAFRLTGDAPAVVCVVVDEAPLDRQALAGSALDELPASTVCTELAPAP